MPMSTTSPKRNPRRMPCFTQTLTRQPVGDDGSGSAERTLPSESSSRKRRNASRASSRGALLPCSNSVVMVVASDIDGGLHPRRGAEHLQVLQHVHHLLARGGAWRGPRQ